MRNFRFSSKQLLTFIGSSLHRRVVLSLGFWSKKIFREKLEMSETNEPRLDSLLALGEEISTRLRARKEFVSIMESSAGGLISTSLLSVAGASHFFRGGGVIYTHEARRELLGIDDTVLEGVRPSSEPYITILAQGLKAKLDTDWILAESGATGPTGNRYGDAPGHACFAIMGPGIERTFTLETGDDDRFDNMIRFASFGLGQLSEALG